MLISIAGPSCSGKTTITRLLAEALNAPTFHLDQHYLAGSDHPIVNGHPSFEQPHQYDAAAMLAQVDAALRQHPVVIAEGFLLFAYPAFIDRSDHMVFLDVPHAELAMRRTARAKFANAASDIVGGRVKKADDGWHAHGEQEWQTYGAFQAAIPGIRVIRTALYGGTDPNSPEAIIANLLREWNLPKKIAA